jgi:hypothetical protein
MCQNGAFPATKMSFKNALTAMKLGICLILDWDLNIFLKGLSEVIM